MTQTGKWIGQAWQLVIRHFWALVLFGLVYSLALMAASFITSGIAIILLVGPVQAGIFAMLLHLIKTGQFEINQIRRGFDRFADCLLAYLVIYAFALILTMVFLLPAVFFIIALIPLLESETILQPGYLTFALLLGGGWLLLLIIAILIFNALYLFPWLLIIDRKLSFWEALETSRKTVQKNLLGFLGFLLTLGAIDFLGLLFFCGLGTLVTLPLRLCAMVFAYRDLWPEEEGIAALPDTAAS